MPRQKNAMSKNSPRQPVQRRGIQTRDKIMDAGEKLFIQAGFHAVLADDIAREAGLSVGSFYSYFQDKRTLFLAILERNSTAILAGADQVFSTLFADENLCVEALVRKTICILIETHRGFLPLHQEAQQMGLRDEAFAGYIRQSDEAVRQVFARTLLRLKPDIDEKRLAAISFVLYHASEGIIHRVVGHPDPSIDEEQVILETTRLFTSFILHSLDG